MNADQAGPDEVEEDLKLIGFSADEISVSWGEEEEPESFEVWTENWETVQWFMRLQRRWIFGAMGGYIRLDDQSIKTQFEIYNVKKKQRPELFDGLLIMESAALENLNRVVE